MTSDWQFGLCPERGGEPAADLLAGACGVSVNPIPAIGALPPCLCEFRRRLMIRRSTQAISPGTFVKISLQTGYALSLQTAYEHWFSLAHTGSQIVCHPFM